MDAGGLLDMDTHFSRRFSPALGTVGYMLTFTLFGWTENRNMISDKLFVNHCKSRKVYKILKA